MVRARQALVRHIFRIGSSVVFKQPLNIPRMKPVTLCHDSNREVAAAEILGDVGLNGMKSRRTGTPILGDSFGVPSCPDRQRHEIMDVRGGQLARRRCREHVLLLQQAEITNQQPQCFRIARYWTNQGIPDVVHEWGEYGNGYVKSQIPSGF